MKDDDIGSTWIKWDLLWSLGILKHQSPQSLSTKITKDIKCFKMFQGSCFGNSESSTCCALPAAGPATSIDNCAEAHHGGLVGCTDTSKSRTRVKDVKDSVAIPFHSFFVVCIIVYLGIFVSCCSCAAWTAPLCHRNYHLHRFGTGELTTFKEFGSIVFVSNSWRPHPNFLYILD